MRTEAIKAYTRLAAERALEARRATSGRAREIRKLRREARAAPRHQPGTIELDGFRIDYIDLISLFMEYKDIFGEEIYGFEASTKTPRIIDGGGYVGMSVLYFKSLYPEARITCFEPDPEVFAVLERNVRQNGLTDVELVCAGLTAETGEAHFVPDGADGGRLTDEGDKVVKTVPLSGYLDEPVDFLKLNIEGFELDVLREAESKLANVRELVFEYHGWPGTPQRLGPLLDLIDRAGFRYLVNHFDYETNGTVRPPFTLRRDTQWFALVYGRRNDLL
jgi:FkbM family methyltransferase